MKPYYEQDGITIYHGDCRDVLPALRGTADLVLTDPPYLVSYKGRWNSKDAAIANDDNDDWIDAAFSGVYEALAPGGVCVSFYGWPFIERFMQAWRKAGFTPVSHLVWVKNRWGLGYYTRGQHEPLFVLASPQSRKPETAISDVIHADVVLDRQHPTQKPTKLMQTIIGAFAEGLVLDPFMGSGTTLRAARNLGLPAIGIEVDERYCEVAARRLQQAVLELAV